jgi:hypothetical protein
MVLPMFFERGVPGLVIREPDPRYPPLSRAPERCGRGLAGSQRDRTPVPGGIPAHGHSRGLLLG